MGAPIPGLMRRRKRDDAGHLLPGGIRGRGHRWSTGHPPLCSFLGDEASTVGGLGPPQHHHPPLPRGRVCPAEGVAAGSRSEYARRTSLLGHVLPSREGVHESSASAPPSRSSMRQPDPGQHDGSRRTHPSRTVVRSARCRDANGGHLHPHLLASRCRGRAAQAPRRQGV